MALVSQLELANSPYEQGSSETVPYTWTPILAAGETCTAATVKVYEYDPRYIYDSKDVTATVSAGVPSVTAGVITVLVTALTAGYEYRIQITTVLSASHTEMRYLRVKCQI